MNELLWALTSEVGTSGPRRQVFLLGPTNRRPTRSRERVLRVGEVQSQVSSQYPDVDWIDTYALTTAPSGFYRALGHDEQGRVVPYRQPDGVHFTRWGGQDLSDRLMPLLEGRLARLQACSGLPRSGALAQVRSTHDAAAISEPESGRR